MKEQGKKYAKIGEGFTVAAALVNALGGMPGCAPEKPDITPQPSSTTANYNLNDEGYLNELCKVVGKVEKFPNFYDYDKENEDYNNLAKGFCNLLSQSFEEAVCNELGDETLGTEEKNMIMESKFVGERPRKQFKSTDIGKDNIGESDVIFGNNGIIVGDTFYPIQNFKDIYGSFYDAWKKAEEATNHDLDSATTAEMAELEDAFNEYKKKDWGLTRDPATNQLLLVRYDINWHVSVHKPGEASGMNGSDGAKKAIISAAGEQDRGHGIPTR